MSTVIKQGLRQQQKSLSERTSLLEENFARVLFGINQRFQAADQRLTAIEELVDALLDLQGRGDVERLVDEKRVTRARAAVDQEKATLEAGIAAGYVLTADTVGARSIVVGKLVTADGVVIEPGRLQLVVPGQPAQFQAQLVGLAQGSTVSLPNGNQLSIDEIYNVDEEKALEVQAADAAAATKAASETATTDEVVDGSGN